MSRFSTAAKVGAFTIVLTVAAVAIYRFVDQRIGEGEGYVVHTYLEDAQGIAQHSQVKMAGIPVGNIKSVKLDKGKARVDIVIDDEVPLFDDAAVSKVSSSLLGEYFLSIAAGTEGKRQLEDGDEIKFVIEAASTDDIMKNVAEITEDVKKVTRALANSVGTDQGEDDIKKTLSNLAEITDNLNKIVAENRQSIKNIFGNVENISAKSQPEIEQILENVRVATADVRQLMAKAEEDPTLTGADAAEDAGEAGEIRQIIEKVNRSATSLESAMENIDVATERIEQGEGTLGRLSKDEKLIDEVEGVAQGVNELVGGFSRLQTIVTLRSEYQFLSGGIKSYLKLRLQPREDKYYLFEVVSDPRGFTSFEQIDTQSTNPNDPPQYREVRTITKNDCRFSFMFGKRIGPMWGRFGILESTGGIGMDLLLLDDRFELTNDVFGFGEVVLPRWRVFLGYEFINHLWLLAGVDDILSTDRRDYFVGLRLRFNDRDLKSMLPFAGGAAGAL